MIYSVDHGMLFSSDICIPLHGFIYDVKSGRLVKVREVTKAGQPR